MNGKINLFRHVLDLQRKISVEDERSLRSQLDTATNVQSNLVVILVPGHRVEVREAGANLQGDET